MKILLIGSGGREHALAWAFKQNPKCQELYCIPGNAGIAAVAKCLEIDILDNNEILRFCRNKGIDFVMIGPEGPLDNGLVDLLESNEILSLGPTKNAAMLETSKAFTKMICSKKDIPTARYKVASTENEALSYLNEFHEPYVIKDDGLAAGKGVFIAKNEKEAREALKKIFRIKPDTTSVVIEEFLDGEEASLFILTDGYDLLILGSAQDHKRAFDNDCGPNTGGMGAYSPASNITPRIEKKIIDRIITPTLDEMREKGTPFCGILYAGLMIKNDEPYLIEYNARLGDPECQVLAIRLGAQLLDVLFNCAQKALLETKINYADDFGIAVVLASKGYPGKYQKGEEIIGLGNISENDEIQVFHSGTALDGVKIVSNGGRVLSITTRSEDLESARKKVYDALTIIQCKGGFYRKDIGCKRSQK